MEHFVMEVFHVAFWNGNSWRYFTLLFWILLWVERRCCLGVCIFKAEFQVNFCNPIYKGISSSRVQLVFFGPTLFQSPIPANRVAVLSAVSVRYGTFWNGGISRCFLEWENSWRYFTLLFWVGIPGGISHTNTRYFYICVWKWSFLNPPVSRWSAKYSEQHEFFLKRSRLVRTLQRK